MQTIKTKQQQKLKEREQMRDQLPFAFSLFKFNSSGRTVLNALISLTPASAVSRCGQDQNCASRSEL